MGTLVSEWNWLLQYDTTLIISTKAGEKIFLYPLLTFTTNTISFCLGFFFLQLSLSSEVFFLACCIRKQSYNEMNQWTYTVQNWRQQKPAGQLQPQNCHFSLSTQQSHCSCPFPPKANKWDGWMTGWLASRIDGPRIERWTDGWKMWPDCWYVLY